MAAKATGTFALWAAKSQSSPRGAGDPRRQLRRRPSRLWFFLPFSFSKVYLEAVKSRVSAARFVVRASAVEDVCHRRGFVFLVGKARRLKVRDADGTA